jgi:hypothetical protein
VRGPAESVSPERVRAILADTRWLVVAGDAVSADALACALRELGAFVRLIDPAGLALARLGAFDAQVLLSERGQDLRFLRERLSSHPILRWTSQLSFPWVEIFEPQTRLPALGRLSQMALPWLEPERVLAKVARSGSSRFEVQLDRLGPIRALHRLSQERDVFRVVLSAQQERGMVELAGELVVGASFELPGFPPLSGVEAFARVLELPVARATVERRVRLSVPSISMPFEAALELALSDIRERDGSESPTLRIPSPLSLMEPDEQALSPPEGLAVVHPLDPPPRPVAIAPPPLKVPPLPMMPSALPPELRDSGVIGRGRPAPIEIEPTEGVGRPTPRPAPAPWPLSAPLSSDSLRPTMVDPPLRKSSRLSWLGVLGAALAVTVAAMIGAEQVWELLDEPEPQARPISAVTSRGETPVPAAAPHIVEKPVPAKAVAEPVAEAKGPVVPAPPTPAADEAQELTDTSEIELRLREAIDAEDAAAAVAWGQRLIELKPERARYRVLYGDALAAAGRSAEALEQYQLAHKWAPRSRLVKKRLARFAGQ